MLSWWRSRIEDHSPIPAKSPTKGDRENKGSNEHNQSTSSKDPKTSDSKKVSYLLQPDRVSILSFKDFVVVLVEICMTFSNHVIRKRKSEAHHYESQLWKTRREIERDLLFVQGWAALGSPLAGALADGYIGNFCVALSSIVIIFVMATCLYVEQVLFVRVNTNPYAELMTEVASVAHLFNRSTGFSRVVFAVENMKNKTPSAISLLIFILTVSGDSPSSGGILMIIAGGVRMSTMAQVRMSCIVSGLSLFLFMYLFKSIPLEKSHKLASRRAIRCIFDGFWHLCIDPCTKRDWKDHVRRHYDKLTLTRAKGLVHYLVVLLPLAGFIFVIIGKFENLYSRISELMTPAGLDYYIGIAPAWAMFIILSMILTYFLVMPGLTYMGYPNQFNYQFSLGNLCALIALYNVALVLKINDKYDHGREIGLIRIYNARDSEVTLIPHVTSSLNASLKIPPHSAAMGTYVIPDDALMILMTVKFDKMTNITIFLRAEVRKCISYAISDPPELIKITKDVPLLEGPPTTNDHKKPRIYLFHASRAFREKTIRFRDLTTGQWILQFVSILGRTDIFQVPPGKYEVWVEGSDLHLHAKFNEGGLYGIMLLADITKSLIELDTVIAKKELPSNIFIGHTIFYGMSLTLSYVTLRTMTYTKAPSGLLNTSFGFLSAQENLAVWVLVLGYYTWHEQILGDTLLTYCFILTVLFFMSVFIMIKYNQFFA